MKSSLSILCIEDDKYTRLNLREILQSYGVIDEAPDLSTAREKLTNNFYDIVLTDIELGTSKGSEIIPLIVKKGSHCIVVSSYEDDEVIEAAYTLGAKHYLSKFRLKEQLPVYIQKFLNEKNQRFQEFLAKEFITQDPELILDLKTLCQVNLKQQCLFISGPTGTGKSLLGKLIHDFTSPEAKLIHLNCSELSETLLESELFGHEKGAFTGADQKKEGKLRLAHGGTLFLDEVATMSLSMQQKLLKALDEKTFYPVGSNTPVRAEFTLITATCEDLQAKIARKEFREDFYFRISGFKFRLKPLCERPLDIELLVKSFQKKASRRYVLKSDALEALKLYSWPGNIRELNKVCERFSQNASGIIDAKEVSKHLQSDVAGSNHSQAAWDDYIMTHGLRSLITQLEKRAVEESLKRNNGKITACIKELKISSSAFYRILQEHQLHF